jgi:hypothetical protein
MKTIAGLAEFLGVPKSRTAKAVFMMATFAEGKEEHERLRLCDRARRTGSERDEADQRR